MAAHLRVYPESLQLNVSPAQDPSIRVSLRDLLPLLATAKRNNYLWLQDFLDDEVQITSDLYEVITAFNYVRPSA